MPRVRCLGCGCLFTGKWRRKFHNQKCFAQWLWRQRKAQRVQEAS